MIKIVIEIKTVDICIRLANHTSKQYNELLRMDWNDGQVFYSFTLSQCPILLISVVVKQSMERKERTSTGLIQCQSVWDLVSTLPWSVLASLHPATPQSNITLQPCTSLNTPTTHHPPPHTSHLSVRQSNGTNNLNNKKVKKKVYEGKIFWRKY